jgi:hypothetical protein
MVLFRPRHICRITMTNLNALAAAATATLLVGCAAPTPPSASTALQPEQVVRSLSARKMTARGDPDAVFGLSMLKTHLQPALDRCRADGGSIEVLGRSTVQFAPRVEGSGRSEAQLLLPSKLACRANSTFAWGTDVRYAETKFFPSQWAGEMYYYATVQLSFVSGTQLELTETSSASNREATRKQSAECTALRQAYTERLRATPAIGMNVAFGTIIELRPPLALIQYDAFGRQMKGREQDWVQISSLSAGSDCPR